jgi:hypothetical protein
VQRHRDGRHAQEFAQLQPVHAERQGDRDGHQEGLTSAGRVEVQVLHRGDAGDDLRGRQAGIAEPAVEAGPEDDVEHHEERDDGPDAGRRGVAVDRAEPVAQQQNRHLAEGGHRPRHQAAQSQRLLAVECLAGRAWRHAGSLFHDRLQKCPRPAAPDLLGRRRPIGARRDAGRGFLQHVGLGRLVRGLGDLGRSGGVFCQVHEIEWSWIGSGRRRRRRARADSRATRPRRPTRGLSAGSPGT